MKVKIVRVGRELRGEIKVVKFSLIVDNSDFVYVDIEEDLVQSLGLDGVMARLGAKVREEMANRLNIVDSLAQYRDAEFEA